MRPPSAETLHRKRAEALAAADTGLWEQADARNPDPARFCPVQVTGFSALHERRGRQQAAAQQVAELLRATRDKIREIEDERRVTFELRLRHYRARQRVLAHRVLRLAAAFERQHLLRCHGGNEPPLDAAELQWLRQLQYFESEVESPASGFERLHELSHAVATHEAAPGHTDALARSLNLGALDEWLSKHQEAIGKLIDVQKADLRDAAIAIEEGGAR